NAGRLILLDDFASPANVDSRVHEAFMPVTELSSASVGVWMLAPAGTKFHGFLPNERALRVLTGATMSLLLRVGGLAACLLLSLGRDGDLELGGERGAVRVGGLAVHEHFPAIALRLLGEDAVLVAGGLVSGAYVLGHEGS